MKIPKMNLFLERIYESKKVVIGYEKYPNYVGENLALERVPNLGGRLKEVLFIGHSRHSKFLIFGLS